MEINYGSTRNLIRAVYEPGQQEHTRLVYIGTVAETGDRMPPIHWGRVGDPIKPSITDEQLHLMEERFGIKARESWLD